MFAILSIVSLSGRSSGFRTALRKGDPGRHWANRPHPIIGCYGYSGRIVRLLRAGRRPLGEWPETSARQAFLLRNPHITNRRQEWISATSLTRNCTLISSTRLKDRPARRGQLRRRLMEAGLRLPLLGNDDETTNRECTRQFVLDPDAEMARSLV
jgi:hypothetical protein